MSEPTFTPRVFSGIQPSGGLTLGNYLGAMKRFVDMQDAGGFETVYCMVDLHAITAKLLDPDTLRNNTRELCAGFIAAGIDPEKSILINQSQVPEHAQLAWIFNCVARMGWMGRMTQWKDKAGKNAEAASLGLLAYPALMAADILIYHATHVPVGEDQKQHLELTRDIAIEVQPRLRRGLLPHHRTGDRGRGDPGDEPAGRHEEDVEVRPSDKTRINMTDDADTIAKKIRKAKTDPDPLPEALEGLENRPDARNLVNIYAALAETTQQAVLDQHAGSLFGHFKVALSDLAVEKLAPISSEMSRLMDDPAEIDRILHRGASAREITVPILEQTYDIVGMLRS
jgi:tryptophanyl-tRNA synthetase